MIFRVSVVLNWTLFDSDCRFDKMCRGSHFQSQSELGGGGEGCFKSVDGV